MKRIIGVHFWEKKVYLCWSEEDSISTASFNLPEDYRRDDILKQEFALQGVFRAIREYLLQKVNITEYALAIAIPDDFGIEDIRKVHTVAREVSTEIKATVTETMAMALCVYGEYEFDGRMLAAVVADNRLSIAEYDYSDAGVQKIETYIAGPWKCGSLEKAPYVHSYSDRLFETNDAGFFFISGSMSAGMTLEQMVKGYMREIDTFGDGEMAVKLLDSTYVIEGLGYLTGKMEGRDAFAGLGVMDTLSPYEILLGINDSIFTVVNAENPMSKNAGLDIRRIPESGGSSEEFTVYEKKGKRTVKLGSVVASKESLENYYKKPVWIGVNVDSKKNVSVVIQNLETEAYIEMPIEAEAGHAAEKKEERDVASFVEKIIPIIDNLEYATKFAQDQDNPYTKGIIQTYENAMKILANSGVQIIAGEGKPFDYNLQNAVAHVTDVDLPENTVKQVMQTGYAYKGKVIRTASVIVAN